MTPAESVARGLQRIAAQEAHSLACNQRGVQLEMQGEQVDCSCDRDARVAARQAEAVLAMLEAVVVRHRGDIHAAACGNETDDYEAALRVLAQRAGLEKP